MGVVISRACRRSSDHPLPFFLSKTIAKAFEVWNGKNNYGDIDPFHGCSKTDYHDYQCPARNKKHPASNEYISSWFCLLVWNPHQLPFVYLGSLWGILTIPNPKPLGPNPAISALGVGIFPHLTVAIKEVRCRAGPGDVWNPGEIKNQILS